MTTHSVSVVGTRESGSAPRPSTRTPRLRADIEGLRGVAVISVVAGHAGVLGFSGGYVGVDVFFVISGFVITGLLLSELRATGRVDLANFYARRAKRLLPMALAVLLVTAVAGTVILNPIRSQQLLGDVGWAAGYVIAWQLAISATDYLNATDAPSAVQHYWSLSIEEQFYLVWPVLLLLLWRLGRSRRRAERTASLPRLVVPGLLTLVLASFAANLWTTAHAQPWAFFGLHARAWELGVGCLLAVALTRSSRPDRARLPTWGGPLLSWTGLAMIAWAVVSYDESLLYPGWHALLPVTGAALVIAGGARGDGRGAARLLERGWLQLCGGLSYGWYLWHWPLLILGIAAWPGLDTVQGRVLLSMAALALAAISYVLLEHPARIANWPLRRPGRAISLALVASATTLVVALGAATILPRLSQPSSLEAAAAQGEAVEPEPAEEAGIQAALTQALGNEQTPAPALPAVLDPDPVNAKATIPRPQRDGCHKDFTDTSAQLPQDCVYGATEATTSVVLIGDSHALQWFPALEQIATERGWKLVSMTKSSCTPFDVRTYNETLRREYTECAAWRTAAAEMIDELDPGLVVMSSQVNQRDHGMYGDADGFTTAWGQGVASAIQRLTSAGHRVAVIEDIANPGQDVPNCIADAMGSRSDGAPTTAECSYGRGAGLDPADRRDAQRTATTAAGATTVDPTQWLCADRCPVVVGDRLVFRDDQHLSTSYAQWLAPALGSRLPT